MVNRMVPLPKFASDPDDGRNTLMRGLMASSAARNFQIRISIKPDLLQLTHKMQYVLARVRIPAYVEGAKLQDALLSQLCFRYIFITNNLSLLIKITTNKGYYDNVLYK